MTLGDILAARLQQVVPAGVEVRAADAGVGVFFAGSDWGSVTLGSHVDYGGDPAFWAERVLDNVQDFVIEFFVKSGWPPVDPANPTARQRAVDLPMPNAEVRDDNLHAWFGDRGSPALVLEPIPFSVGDQPE